MDNLNRKYEFSMNVEQLDSVFSTGAKFSTKDVKTGELHIQLAKSGNIINLNETLCYANILKPDGEVIAHECEVIDVERGIIKLDLVTDAMNQPGLYNFEIVVTNSEEKLVTPTMQYQCYESLNDGDKIEASNEFGLLEKALIKVDLLRSEFEALYENLERNESTRVSNESIRTQNENQRQTNESNRVSSEQNRQASFNKMVQDNNSYKDEIKNVINEFKEDINSDFDNYKKGINSDIFDDNKIDFFGKEHDSMKHRLNSDFDNLHQRMNDSSLLAYEGTSIKADNTYLGLAKDTVIKGRTLQNLAKNNRYTTKGEVTTDYAGAIPNVYTPTIKPNTVYSVCLFSKGKYDWRGSYFENDREIGVSAHYFKTNTFVKFTTENNPLHGTVGFRLYLRGYDIPIPQGTEFKLMILEGDYTQTPLEELPFIEGIESTGDKSKNLIDLSTLQKSADDNEFEFLDNGEVLFKGDGVTSKVQPFVEVKAKPNTNMVFTAKTKEDSNFYVEIYTLNEGVKTFMCSNYNFKNTGSLKFNTGNAKSVIVYLGKHSSTSNDITVYDVQLEEGETATPCQPYYDGYKISGKSYGKNLIDVNKLICGYYYNPSTGELTNNNYACCSEYLKYNKQNITISGVYNQVSSCICYFDINYNFIGRTSANPVSDFKLTVGSAITDSSYRGNVIPANAAYLTINFYKNNSVNENVTTDIIKENLKCLQIEENSIATAYEPYKESSYSYILGEPLRSLPNGVCDTIDLETGVLTRRVGKVVLDGEEEWKVLRSNSLTSVFNLDFKSNNNAKDVICDTINGTFVKTFSDGVQGIKLDNSSIYINILNNRLVTLDVDGFKQWLQDNPTTVVYELAEPTTEQLTPQQLKSFDTTTHIISDNKLMPIVSTKIPSDVNAVVQNLKVENKNLEKQLDSAIEELNNTDIDLIAMDWETDYRLCELEWTLLGTMKVETLEENKVVESRILSRYEQAKILIESGKYNKSTMEKQLTTYHNKRCLTDEEYNELMELMNR